MDTFSVSLWMPVGCGGVTNLTYSKASIQRDHNKCFRIDLAESLRGSLGKMQWSEVKAG